MTVWIAHPVEQDTTSSQQYGEPAYINDGYIYGDEVSPSGELPEDFQSKMMQCIIRFDPKRDFLLMVGDHLQLLALTAMLSRIHGRFRVLRYDRMAKGYLSVWIGSA